MKTILKTVPRLLTWKMSLLLLSMLLFAGLTACDQTEKAMDEVTQPAEQAIEMAKDKAATMLDSTEEKDAKEQSTEKEEEEQE